MHAELTEDELDFYATHFDRLDPRELDLHQTAVRELASRCPMTRSDVRGGYWVVSDYQDIMAVYQNWQSFSSVPGKSTLPRSPAIQAMPPIDVDPPVHLDRTWTHAVIFDPAGPDTPTLKRKWDEWVRQIIEQRRRGPRQDDMIDGLLHAEVGGEPLDDQTIASTIQVLIMGGF